MSNAISFSPTMAETAPSSSVAVPRIAQPTTLSSDVIANRAGALRNDVGLLSHDVAAFHSESLAMQLAARTDEAAKRAPTDLIEEIAALGFSWTGVARLCGVSIPALRKWRQGEPPSGENRRKLAQIVAFVGVVANDHLITDVASWLDVPLAGTSISGLELFAAGHVAELLEYAAEKLDSTLLLDRTVSGWRLQIDSQFEVFDAEDGERAIRLRQVGVAE
jgi:transcriptional regulator with XRE-family HTH domain